MKKTIIVMPVANEEKTMQQIIDKIMALPYDELYLYPVIDSYSKDKTEEIIRNAEQTYNGRVKCIFHEKSTGLISCYLYGFTRALGDNAEFVIEMDGGGSHDPAELPQFIENLEKGYDCVWGSRFVKGGSISNHPLYRRLLSSGGTFLSNLILHTKLKDMTSGYEAFNADVLKQMDLDKFLSTGHMYQTEMRFYCKDFNTVEVPITYIGGESSLKPKAVFEAIKLLFMLKKNRKNVFIKKEVPQK
ncbi:MAG: glycosyltransferase [Oscillospiraceae bacterium]